MGCAEKTVSRFENGVLREDSEIFRETFRFLVFCIQYTSVYEDYLKSVLPLSPSFFRICTFTFYSFSYNIPPYHGTWHYLLPEWPP